MRKTIWIPVVAAALITLITLTTACNVPGNGSSRLKDPPNILLYFVDDVGWTDLACFGSKFYETPNLDKLARDGMKFTNAYSNAGNCAPTRGSLLTGMYNPRHGTYTVGSKYRFDNQRDLIKWEDRKLLAADNKEYSDSSDYTFGEYLHDAGYTTGWFGKIHYMNSPKGRSRELAYQYLREKGFDEMVLYGNGRHYNITTYPPDEIDGDVYLSDYMADKAIAFINQACKNDQPFFCYVPDYLCHVPLEAKAELVKKYEQKEKDPYHNHPVYAAMIDAMDQTFGRLIDCLEENQVLDNTLIIFTSDNGGVGSPKERGMDSTTNLTSNYPLRGMKGMLYEGGIRVPMIISWPGVTKAGSVCAEPVQSSDIFPSFIDLVGAEARPGTIRDGASMLPLLEDPESRLNREDIFWHMPGYLPGRQRPASVIRSRDYKLIENFEDGSLELYNLVNDLRETTELSGSEPEITAELYARLKAWQKEVNAPIPERNIHFDPALEGKWTYYGE